MCDSSLVMFVEFRHSFAVANNCTSQCNIGMKRGVCNADKSSARLDVDMEDTW